VADTTDNALLLGSRRTNIVSFREGYAGPYGRNVKRGLLKTGKRVMLRALSTKPDTIG
jgi:hypothetical protein